MPNPSHLPDELLKFYFEFFKHFTTLNTAAALVVVALHDLASGAMGLVVPLLAFGASLVVSLDGMDNVITTVRRENLAQDVWFRRRIKLAVATFLAGLFGAASSAVNLL